MGKCSLNICNNECFEKEKECIFHCNKNENNNWILNKKEKELSRKWNPKLLNLFWKEYIDGNNIPKKSKVPPITGNMVYKIKSKTKDDNIYDGINIFNSCILDGVDICENIDVLIANSTIFGDIEVGIFNIQKEEPLNISLHNNMHNGNIDIKTNAKVSIQFRGIVANEINLVSENNKLKTSFSDIYMSNYIHLDNKFSKWKKTNKPLTLSCYQQMYNRFYKTNMTVNKINLKNTNISDKFIMKEIRVDNFDCSNSVFEQKVEIKKNNINISSFQNTRFKFLCDFYKTQFNSNNFEKTTFEDISVFTESIFNKEVNFKFTTFEKLALFRKTVFKKGINLIDSIIKEEANFLEITSQKSKVENITVANRETARIIKHSFEQQSNIIEANKFYKLEMKEREKELENEIQDKERRTTKSFVDYIIFKFHGISSNHSQDIISPLIWIFSLSFFYLTLIQINQLNYSFDQSLYLHIVNLISIFITFSLYYKKCEVNHIEKVLYVGIVQLSYLKYISGCSYQDIFNTLADKINPFSIMTSKDPITFGLLLFKITIAYLIYQFIVSIRQNTRRK